MDLARLAPAQRAALLAAGVAILPLAYYVAAHTALGSFDPWEEVRAVFHAMTFGVFSRYAWAPGYVRVFAGLLTASLAVLALYRPGARLFRWIASGR